MYILTETERPSSWVYLYDKIIFIWIWKQCSIWVVFISKVCGVFQGSKNEIRIISLHCVVQNGSTKNSDYFKGLSHWFLFTLSQLKWIDQVVKENWSRKNMTSPPSFSLSYLYTHTLHSLNTHSFTQGILCTNFPWFTFSLTQIHPLS